MNDHPAEPGQEALTADSSREGRAQPSAADLRLAQLDATTKSGEVLPAALIGKYQAELGREWAAAYSETNQATPPTAAEIALRNPQVYLQNSGAVEALASGLQDRWASLVDYADVLATRGDQPRPPGAQPRQWSQQSNGLDKLHMLVESGEMNSNYRGAVGDVIRTASDLFAESVLQQPGNLRYFQEKLVGTAYALDSFTKK